MRTCVSTARLQRPSRPASAHVFDAGRTLLLAHPNGWDADVAARAVKLILHGIVDTEGVSGLAKRLGYGERQLHRVLIAEVGTGALALARAQRAQTARLLLETTGLPVTHVAFAAGFASVRQFNDTVKAVFARTPTELRLAASKRKSNDASSMSSSVPRQTISLRLAYREPFAGRTLFAFLGARAIPGVEHYCSEIGRDPGIHKESVIYRRSLGLPNGSGTVTLALDDGFVRAAFALEDLRDLTTAVPRCRHLCNLDSDPVAVDEALSDDPHLRKLVRGLPGIRVPGAADGFELRDESSDRATGVGHRGEDDCGKARCTRRNSPSESRCRVDPHISDSCRLGRARREVARGFPDAGRPKGAHWSPSQSGWPRGGVTIDVGTEPAELESQLLAIPGIGPWTSAYIVMRALGNPDSFMPTDLGIRKAAAVLGLPVDPAPLAEHAERWRPWRSYALCHMWSAQLPTGVPSVVPRAEVKRERKGETRHDHHCFDEDPDRGSTDRG